MFKTKEEFLAWVEEKKAEEKKFNRKEHFRNLKPFETIHDIPNLPVVDKEEWDNFYVPILIEKGAIPKADLKDGNWYIGDHRRCKIAKWNETKNCFEYIRTKFNAVFWDKCNHFQDDDGFALFVPIREANQEEISQLVYPTRAI